VGASVGLTEEICDIVNRRPRTEEEETVNYRCLRDAEHIVHMGEELKEGAIGADDLERRIEAVIFTETGKKLAKEALKV
jgi:hypothetical protein